MLQKQKPYIAQIVFQWIYRVKGMRAQGDFFCKVYLQTLDADAPYRDGRRGNFFFRRAFFVSLREE